MAGLAHKGEFAGAIDEVRFASRVPPARNGQGVVRIEAAPLSQALDNEAYGILMQAGWSRGGPRRSTPRNNGPSEIAADSHRMLSLLRKPSIVHNPRHYRTVFLHRRQHLPTNFSQYLLVTPGRDSHHMMQALVHATNAVGRKPRRHRLDALALSGQQQPLAVAL